MKTPNDAQMEFEEAAKKDSDRVDVISGNRSEVLSVQQAVSTTGPARDEAPLRLNSTKSTRARKVAAPPGGVESLLTFAEAARVLGISLRQFRRLVDRGKVAFVKVSERAPRVRPSELQRFLEASAVSYPEVQS